MTTMNQGRELKDLLTIAAAASFLGVHPDTLRNWDRSGKLPAFRHPINGYRLYSLDDLRQIAVTTVVQTKGNSGV